MKKIQYYNILLKSTVVAVLLMILPTVWVMVEGQTVQNVDFHEPGTFIYTVPAGITELVVECWGAGGGGSAGMGLLQGAGSPGSGGGGGAHAHSIIEVTPGQQLTFVIGKGGAGGTNPWNHSDSEGKKGENTLVYDQAGNLLVGAEGGSGGKYFDRLNGGSKGGIGGRYQASKGEVIHPGGKGADAGIVSGQEYSGGGGGAAGRTHGGYNADGMLGGKAGTCYCGIPGAGGAGRNTTGHGNPGVNTENVNRGVIYGAGGGAGGFDATWGAADGGKGADGHIRLREQVDVGEITGGNTMEVGSMLQLFAPVSGGTWRSSLTDVATVDEETGLVLAHKQGVVVISYHLGDFLTGQSTEIILYVYPEGGLIVIHGDLYYCEDGTQNITLEAAIAAGDDYDWNWIGPGGFEEGNSSFNRPALAENAGIYTVTAVRYDAGGTNLIVDGDFEIISTDSNDFSFSSDYDYDAYNLGAGVYNVATKPKEWQFDFADADHTTGSGMFLSLRGNGTANTVWKQTVEVEEGAQYEITFHMISVQAKQHDVASTIDLKIMVDGMTQVGNIFSVPTSQEKEGWSQFKGVWQASASGEVEVQIKLDKNISENYLVGLDDIAMYKLSSEGEAIITQDVEVFVGSHITPNISIISVPDPPVAGQVNKFIANATAVGLRPAYNWYVNEVLKQDGHSVTFSAEDLEVGDIVKCEVEIQTESFACIDIPEGGVVAEVVVQEAPGAERNLWVGTINEKWYALDNWSLRRVPELGESIEFATEENYRHSANRDLVISNPDIDGVENPGGEGDPDWTYLLTTVSDYINYSDKKLIIAPSGYLSITNDVDTDGINKITLLGAEEEPMGTLLLTKEGMEDKDMPVATVEFYSKAFIDSTAPVGSKYNWQYFGIPVQEIEATPTFSGAFVRRYNETLPSTEPGEQWEALKKTSMMVSFDGYEIVQDEPKIYAITGNLVRRDFSRVLTRTIGSYYQGQHVLSNPYTAAMEIEHIDFGDALEKTVYVYNTGTFNDWDTGVTDWESPGSYIAIPQNQAEYVGITQIPPMGGFLVRVSGKNGSTDLERTIAYSYDNLANNTTNMRSVRAGQSDKSAISMKVSSEHSADRAWLFHEDHCSPGYDNGWDGRKIIAPRGVQLLISEGEELYQVSSTNNLDGVSLGVIADERDRDYTLTLELQHIYPQYRTLWLHDRKENAKIELKQGTNSYKFRMSRHESNTDRFQIVTQQKVEPQLPVDMDIVLQVRDQSLQVRNRMTERGELTIVDASGREVISRYPIEAGGSALLPFALPKGIYISKWVSGGKVQVRKFVK